LADVAENTLCQELAGGILARAAHSEAPVNVRNRATVGGCVVSNSAASGGASPFVLVLAALDARVMITDGQERAQPLLEVLASPAYAIGRGLIVELRIPWPAAHAQGGLAHVGRTPADQPIVAAAAVRDGRGARVAMGGIASTPLVLQIDDFAELEGVLASLAPELDTPDDFRGSAQYRQAMAVVMAQRALAQATA
jgi:CO/xanthine dehydrogenase FAD-binding subunit